MVSNYYEDVNLDSGHTIRNYFLAPVFNIDFEDKPTRAKLMLLRNEFIHV